MGELYRHLLGLLKCHLLHQHNEVQVTTYKRPSFMEGYLSEPVEWTDRFRICRRCGLRTHD